ncbi:MAG: sensor histidine kinase [bacterium]
MQSALENELDELRKIAGDIASLAERPHSDAESLTAAVWENLARISTEISERLIEIGQRVDEIRATTDAAEGRCRIAEERARDIEAQLAQSERWASLGKRAAEIGADIKNSLTIVNARCQILDLAAQGGEVARLPASIQVIRAEVERAQENIVELVDLSRERARLVPRDVNAVVRATVEFASSLPRFENIQFVPHFEEGLPSAAVDVGQMQQLLVNLFANAADAMGRRRGEGGRVWITTAHLVEANAIEVGVRDEGPGVPAALHERVFDTGFTTRDSRRGAGLAVARQIAALHGGTLLLAPPNGERGADFRLRVPLAPPQGALTSS